ncbi:unnamed protein product [Coffea canephora]|uniref:Protein RALF-like 34 n=1 Tax=Coffea canephora TaxID=49390 RepID=A0A068U2F1_COFCA|nr:protein RALF-like 34 [Coffea arabica]CDP02502.1 unnamed protein product [Coffea canephora]
MESSKCCYLWFWACSFLLILTSKSLVLHRVLAQAEEAATLQLKADSSDWPAAMMSLYDAADDVVGDNDDEMEMDDDAVSSSRRSLFWRRVRYYISYAALSANRIPCPPRSGRSYYTHHCYFASGPVHPYNRGCSAITRCRR